MSEEEENILNNKLSDAAEVGIFKKSDYDLDLNKRKANFEKFNYILCESCNQKTESSNFICYNCYNQETDNDERYRMNYGICEVCSKPNTPLGCCKIFKTSDYDLCLNERIMKYKNFNCIHIFCEKCNQEINKEDYYCYDCYDKETDNNKQNWMKYGGKFVIFKTSDYDLNFSERKERYKDYDHIFCEKCNQEINKDYYCYNCYDEETDNNEKNRMEYGICKVCFKSLDNAFGWCSSCKIESPKAKIFKTSDYDLNLGERKEKYKDYDHILCEECNQEINKKDYCCYDCYDKKTDDNEKNWMEYGICKVCFKSLNNAFSWCSSCKIEGPKVKINTSDYDLNLEERNEKYKDYHNYIFCEKCNQEIYEDYYCYDCYDEKTDIKEKNRMEYGICKVCFKSLDNAFGWCSSCKIEGPKVKIFKISDYDLNLGERKEKYKDYNHILCEECNQEINKKDYYCYDCYDKKTDNNEKNWVEYGICKVCFKSLDNAFGWCLSCKIEGPKVKIFKTSDYDLNFSERKERYKYYNHILCEECNQKIDIWNYYCYDCYDKKTDNNEKNWMEYGICKVCFKSLDNAFGWCSSCKIEGPKAKIFKTSDYNLNLGERKEKYKDYDHILCEECIQEINKKDYYCYDCYDKKTDNNEKNWMEYGICKVCFKSPLNAFGWCSSCKIEGPKVKIFKTSDYDLNLGERNEKYKDYNHILCEECNQKINIWNYYCIDCIYKKTDSNERNWMEYGICKVCFKLLNNAFGWCSSCKIEGPKAKIFKTSDYNLNLEERKEKYKDYDHILCEECNQEINEKDYYCYDCYDKKTDNNEKTWMEHGIYKVLYFKSLDNVFCWCSSCIEGSKVKIFKTSDYDLNLEERKEKYKDYYNCILCEECNQKINIWNYYCTDCYYKKTDNNERNWMKYGICKVCFKSLDSNAFGWCSSCKIEGPKAKIFKILDYDLNLEERKEKYKDYDHILCEECDKEINMKNYYCIDCYYKITDNNEKNWVEYGICKVCFKSLDNAFGWCSSCKIEGPKVKIFKISDYDLNLGERKEKYKDYDHILCEKCTCQISKEFYYCGGCYCEKEVDSNEKKHMKFGRCKVCLKSNTSTSICCSTYDFKKFLEGFDKWLHEYKATSVNISNNEPKVGISDHDLDEDDRQVKYNDYDYILCGKCNKKFHYYYCYDCYDKKTKELEEFQFKLQDYENFHSRLYEKERKTKELKELKELHSILKDYENVYFNLNDDLGMFNQIIQKFENIRLQIENGKAQMENIRYNGICECFHEFHSYCYNCYNKETDSNEKECIELGRCKECFRINDKGLDDCSFCRSKRIQRNFEKWDSENEKINKLIQNNQLSAKRYELLEWIPYYKFTNIKYLAKGGFAKVYSATWIDGQIKKWSQLTNNWIRSGPLTVALKVLNDSENISEDFLNEIKFFNKVNSDMCVIKCFGITQDPNTHNYALVLQYMENGDLRSYLKQTVNSLTWTWKQKLNNIYDICLALNNIHNHKLVHKDLHPGNIFIGSTFAYIGDFGFCMPANESLSNSNIYGVMPYIAPEILRGKPYTLASDIYSLGIIINEIITVIPPFNGKAHSGRLLLDICKGLRPTIRTETPNSLKELIERCWNTNPEKRPTSKEILFILSNQLHEYKNMPLKKLSYNLDELTSKPHPQAIYSSRLISSRNTETGKYIDTSHSDCADCAIPD